MSKTMLHIFALNSDIELRHTYLSRANGEISDLPDLAGWLGLRQGGVDTDEIEVFPISDLAGMDLAQYVSTAFALRDAPTGQTLTRINALEGHVLLVRDAALAGTPEVKPELTLIASLPLAQPDHSADALQAAPVREAVPTADPAPANPAQPVRVMRAIFIALVIAVLIVVVSELW